MGTVHGVYLKYVGLSALSFVGYSWMLRDTDGGKLSLADFIGQASRSVALSASLLSRVLPILALGYSTLLNGTIAILFKLERGMFIIGKNRKTGEIPKWSYVVFFPFHVPTVLYTIVHTHIGTQTFEKDGKKVEELVPVASEVQPGWWIGGCHADKLDKDWAGVVDLTVEFPESTINRTKAYLSIPTWDGVPASPDQIEEAADFAVTASRNGDVLVHCAHGRGRSTTIMCACLVKAGLYSNWVDAFEKGIKPRRPCCKLNSRMKSNLTSWQATYVQPQDKKAQ
jgi:Dual specificity phosphatase, catalytic domain